MTDPVREALQRKLLAMPDDPAADLPIGGLRDEHREAVRVLEQHVRALDAMSRPLGQAVTQFTADENKAKAIAIRKSIDCLRASQPPAAAEPQAKALEFAEYMAKGAEHFIEALNAEDELRLRREESDDVDDDEMYDAACSRGEASRALRSDIYEFRKRAAKVAAPSPQPTQQAAPAVQALTEQLIELALDSDASGRPALTLADVALSLRATLTQGQQEKKE